MSTKTTPEAPDGYHSPFGQELAPSALREDEPRLARIVGLIGLCAVVVGTAVVAMNWWAASQHKAPRLFPEWAGYLAMIFGIGGLLYHAARDADVQIRRTYGAAGALLVLVAIAFVFVPAEGQVGAWFLPISVPALLFGLFFLLPFARHEDDPTWRRNLVVGVTAIGAALALAGLLGGCISAKLLLPYGAVAALLGLLYLSSGVGLIGAGSDAGYRLAQGVGVLGALVVVAAVIRSSVGTHYLVPDGLVLIGAGILYVLLSIGVCSERQVVVLTRRELAAYFSSPIAYIVLFVMAVICWLNFWFFVSQLAPTQPQQQGVPEPILRYYVVGLLPVFGVLLVVPALTMRMLSEEQRTGTLEVMLTAPLNEVTLVFSKFLGGLLFFVFVCLPLFVYLIPLRVEGGSPFDVLPLVSFFMALVCSGAAFVAMGLFFSSLTRNQIISFVLTVMGMVILLCFYVFSTLLGKAAPVVRPISFVQFWFDSLGGKLYLRDVIGQLSFAAFWLFLTVKVLESRRWK